MMQDTLRDRLVPSLLDRLTDTAPDKQEEAASQRVLSVSQLRASVLRDLAWLFNTTRLDAGSDAELPTEVKRSVVNYGLPALSGRFISGINLKALEREFRNAILCYEPRLIPETVIVTALVADDSENLYNIVSFNIRAQLWAQPAPVELSLMTDLDLETGQCRVTESGTRR